MDSISWRVLLRGFTVDYRINHKSNEVQTHSYWIEGDKTLFIPSQILR